MQKLGPIVLQDIVKEEKELEMDETEKTTRELNAIDNVKDSEDPSSLSASSVEPPPEVEKSSG